MLYRVVRGAEPFFGDFNAQVIFQSSEMGAFLLKLTIFDVLRLSPNLSAVCSWEAFSDSRSLKPLPDFMR